MLSLKIPDRDFQPAMFFYSFYPVLFLSTSLSSNRQYLGEHFTSYVTHRNTGYSMQSQ